MEALLNKNDDFVTLTYQDNKKIFSGLITLKNVVEYQLTFNIPIYQRLYVWKSNQIKTLLEDIKNAFLKDINYDFFLGGVMLSNNESKIDLVDGQQRFTTLWLICDELSKHNQLLKNFTYLAPNEPRIYFSIRDKAQNFLKDKESFKEFLNDKGEIIKGAESEVSEIIPLVEGRSFIKGFLNEFQDSFLIDLSEFANFLYTQINLTYTFIPNKSDMNRVFEAMNNRGKQLEHHELLKSKLLQKIPKERRLTYALIWDACSDMNTYIEKSVKDVADLNWKDLYGSTAVFYEENLETKLKFEIENIDILQILKTEQTNDDSNPSLLEILRDPNLNVDNKSKKEIIENEYSSKSIRSIISFPAFLLHTLRVYQLKNGFSKELSAEVIDKKLLEVFNVEENFNTQYKAECFLELLWKIRVLFDKYVVKWIYNHEAKEEFHGIESIQLSKSILKNKNGTTNETISVQRLETTDEILKDLIKLQGMLYHSQEMTTQYWLTPFLYFLQNEKLSNQQLLEKLEILENILFYSTKNTSKLKERTFEVVFQNFEEELNHLENTQIYLRQCSGTHYPNYIFYKLEYILWKNRNELCSVHQLDIHRWNSFRLTAKNSVEHIFPQKSKEENKHINYISDDELNFLELDGKHPIDDFGNLVLLSPGMNSEYSNMPYKQKKGKYDSKTDADSLKSELIFKNTDWDWKKAVQHRNEMIKLMNEYLSKLKRS
ncbi:DUF262 domain-containing protein [Chryseobacterium sp. BIGb0232]|uniref:DUF262 domain-containing protein n=1 Tax=Chryseobacterium sp. BIGb0232 TaxID=2940598 RepID=UPI000F4AB05B|nr:DUF262 domain-containing protein [Chryseobacterium sp. BIGb0232]MCS4300611.1 uncharacterized protein with ParB-like and HNH nuclease domain [Chryseobacterium sp. BIGb0232]ROS20503.1 uncharacterized protein DUF1524 [Chryseobacterium nakagawai]